jgi:hypothetical protein
MPVGKFPRVSRAKETFLWLGWAHLTKNTIAATATTPAITAFSNCFRHTKNEPRVPNTKVVSTGGDVIKAGPGLGGPCITKTMKSPQRSPWGWLRSACDILCLFYAKCPRWFRNTPGRLSRKIKNFPPKTCIEALCATSPYKNLVKN